MAEALPALLTPEEYLRFEDKSQTKHEYLGGIVHAMSGGTNRHSIVSGNAYGLLFSQLRGKPCFPITSDVKIRIQYADHTRYYYPDAGVVCESNPPTDHYQDKPVVLIEVLSPSSKRTDMVEKRDAYLGISSLAAYLVIDPDQVHVTLHRNVDGGPSSADYISPDDMISLPEIDCTLTLADIYERVDFSE
jgi:Uma2 family endonuclease